MINFSRITDVSKPPVINDLQTRNYHLPGSDEEYLIIPVTNTFGSWTANYQLTV